MRKPDCIKGAYCTTVATKEAAWEMVYRLFGTCYDLDEQRSLTADRPVCVSTRLGEESFFTDYGDSIRIDYIDCGRFYHEAFRIYVAADDREKVEVLLNENKVLKREVAELRKRILLEEPPFDPDPDGTKGNR